MSFIRNLYDALYQNLIGGGAYLRIIKGCVITVLLFVLAVILSVALAAVLTFLRTSSKKALRAFSDGVTFIFKGTPIYLALLLFYYCFLGSMSRGGLICAVLALCIYGGGHLSDILTRAVKREAKKRSTEVNERARREFFSALLPYITEQSLFEIQRLLGILLQMSAVVGVIGVQDLTQVLLQNGLRTRLPFFALFCGVIFYLLLQLLLALVFRLLRKRFVKERE